MFGVAAIIAAFVATIANAYSVAEVCERDYSRSASTFAINASEKSIFSSANAGTSCVFMSMNGHGQMLRTAKMYQQFEFS